MGGYQVGGYRVGGTSTVPSQYPVSTQSVPSQSQYPDRASTQLSQTDPVPSLPVRTQLSLSGPSLDLFWPCLALVVPILACLALVVPILACLALVVPVLACLDPVRT